MNKKVLNTVALIVILFSMFSFLPLSFGHVIAVRDSGSNIGTTQKTTTNVQDKISENKTDGVKNVAIVVCVITLVLVFGAGVLVFLKKK